MSRTLLGLGSFALTLGALALASVDAGASDSPSRAPAGSLLSSGPGTRQRSRVVLTAQKKPRRKKAAPKKSDATEAPEKEAAPAAAPASDGALKFSRDIAPIFVSNCLGCHNPKDLKGKLDLTTFEKMMQGTPKEKVIVASKPEESHLVLRIKGAEKPKMPQGANRNLSQDAIDRIEQWVKAGAVLDKGLDPKALIESYAATPEDLRKSALARMKPDERDKQVEKVGLERWKKASPKTIPQVTPSKNFLLFAILPKGRAESSLRVMEQQHPKLRALLGPSATDWGEKASLYVFNDRNSFVEFARTIENREVDSDEQGVANFTVAQPYVAVLDPYKGGEEPLAAKRARRKDDDTFVADRSLAGLLTEQLAMGTLAKAGKPPKWLVLGLGAFLSSRVDTRSPYFRKLRASVYNLAEPGEPRWVSEANDALGGQAKIEQIRAVGFTLIEWLATEAPSTLPRFIHGLLEGGEKLDDVISSVLNVTREEFYNRSYQFIGTRYGKVR
jgi:mono/diheme cytochrome c family protein